MFQLNHILTEQKNLMEEMTKIFVSKTKGESNFHTLTVNYEAFAVLSKTSVIKAVYKWDDSSAMPSVKWMWS